MRLSSLFVQVDGGGPRTLTIKHIPTRLLLLAADSDNKFSSLQRSYLRCHVNVAQTALSFTTTKRVQTPDVSDIFCRGTSRYRRPNEARRNLDRVKPKCILPENIRKKTKGSSFRKARCSLLCVSFGPRWIHRSIFHDELLFRGRFEERKPLSIHFRINSVEKFHPRRIIVGEKSARREDHPRPFTIFRVSLKFRARDGKRKMSLKISAKSSKGNRNRSLG